MVSKRNERMGCSSVRLINLDPRWLTPDVFIFRNPTGGKHWLTCPRVRMTNEEQRQLFDEKVDEDNSHEIVGWNPDHCWQYAGDDFTTMSVTPSIDASASGDWHGHITNGEIVGGL